MLGNHLTHDTLTQPTGSGDPANLIGGGRWAHVRIQSTPGGGDQVHRDRGLVARVRFLEGRDPCLRGLHQGGVERAIIGAGRAGEFVAVKRRVARRARRGETPPEIFRVVEGLPNEGRADGLSVPDDKTAIGLPWKDDLGNTRHDQRVDQPGEYGENAQRHQGRAQLGSHGTVSSPRPGAAPPGSCQ